MDRGVMLKKRAFEAAVGISGERTYWAPGGFDNVPAASDPRARAEWVHAVATIKEPHVFLDPDTGSTIATLVGQRKWYSSVNSSRCSPRGRP